MLSAGSPKAFRGEETKLPQKAKYEKRKCEWGDWCRPKDKRHAMTQRPSSRQVAPFSKETLACFL